MIVNTIQSQHKKELRSFQTVKRISLKKLKGTVGKGKKGRDALAAAECEWVIKEQKLHDRHALELQSLPPTSINMYTGNTPPREQQQVVNKLPTIPFAKRKAIEKKMRKREKEKQNEAALHEQNNHADSSARDIELRKINDKHLHKENMTIKEIQADGNCMYRAIAHQMQLLGSDTSHEVLRMLCAEELTDNRTHYEPFVNLDDVNATSFEQYVDIIKDGNEGAWGGHLELRALACKLKRNIYVYEVENDVPLVIHHNTNVEEEGYEEEGSGGVLRLSFHKDYFALGEHYNSVVPMKGEPEIC